jgi:hypothetical protein
LRTVQSQGSSGIVEPDEPRNEYDSQASPIALMPQLSAHRKLHAARLAMAISAAVTLSGCWMIRAHHLANSIESNLPLNACIKEAGVEPIELATCIRHSPNKRASHACAPPVQERAVRACIRDCPTHIFWATVCRQRD